MNYTKLEIAVGRSNIIFKKLKVKYPELDGHLVFSSPYGQCRLTTDRTKILDSFPQMIVDGKQKENVLHLLQKVAEIESEKKKDSGKQKSSEKFKLKLTEAVSDLEFNDDIFVEIRFNHVNLDLIFEVKQDELISQEHTPKTKASIQVVLGTIGELSKMSFSE
jgi:hypothetical protein